MLSVHVYVLQVEIKKQPIVADWSAVFVLKTIATQPLCSKRLVEISLK